MANWLLAPVWPLAIFSSEKAFSKNPLLRSERLNRRGLHAFRVALAARLAERRRRKLAHLVTAEEREAFARDGAIVKQPLSDDAFQKVRDEVMAVRAPAYEMREGDAITRRIAVTPEILKSCPALKALLTSKEYQGPIRYVGSFDTAPYLYIQTIYTHVNGDTNAPDPQNDLHMDTFHSTVKAWLWLDDVDEAMGPFAYVFGSHKVDQRRLAWHKRRSVLASTGGPSGGSFRVSEAERTHLRLPEAHKFVVPKGTMVAGDTFGFHRRTRATRPSRRVELWASSRPNPFYPFVKNWFWPLPGLEHRQAILWQKYATWAHKKGLRARKDWHYVGIVTPASDPVHTD